MAEYYVTKNSYLKNGCFCKKIKRVIIFCFCVFFFSSPFSTAQNFFPSEMGNQYQIHNYYFHDYGINSYFYVGWKANAISSQIIINGNRFIKFSGNALPLMDYYYFDETSALLYVKTPYDSVRLAINFNIAPGDSFISYINGNAAYYVAEAAQVINFFGQQVLTKKFVHTIRGANTSGSISYTFAENIGLIEKSESEVDYQPFDYYMIVYKVRSAIIDTINVYGPTSVQINSLTPLGDRHENQFPFTLLGNYSSTLNVQGYAAPDDLVDSFYIKVTQIRGSDTLGTFQYSFDTSGHAIVNLLPHAGDKLLLRAYISDSTIFHNSDIFPGVGYAVINVLPPLTGPNYFPMKEGNSYQFLYIWSLNYPYPDDTSFIKLDIIKGDSIGGHLFYRFVVTGNEHHTTFNPLQQFRYDSSNAKLWTKFPGDPIRLAVDFEFPDSYTSYILGTPLTFTPAGIIQDTILGQQCAVYTMYHSQWSPPPEQYIGFTFASGIGLSHWYYSSPQYKHNDYTLIAAIIDSIAYSGPVRIDSITPEGNIKINQFPIQVKTFYNMEHFSVVDSFYLFMEHYRNGLLLESFVKYVPHTVSLGYSYRIMNFPDRQIGDIIKLRAEASDTCMLHHHIVYPDTGWVVITITDSISETDDIPESITYCLAQNYPNPFNPSTTISYSIPERGKVRLIIYDALGREVRKLVDEEKEAGIYEINFNAEGLASGMYFYRLSAGERVLSKKMILLK